MINLSWDKRYEAVETMYEAGKYWQLVSELIKVQQVKPLTYGELTYLHNALEKLKVAS